MKNYLVLMLLVIVVFLSGCTTTKKEISSIGISSVLTSDTKEIAASMPVTFILTIKNMASETATDISSQLLNLTGWRIENQLQYLDELLPSDLYKFTWIAYASSETNKTFTPFANVFYKMKTKTNLKLRVYDNDYVNTLKPDERDKIRGSSALISSNISKNTPISIEISLQQPFILSNYAQSFPFVIEIKNIGSGQPYRDYTTYPLVESDMGYVRFSYTGNFVPVCDFGNGELVMLVNGSKSIVCRMVETKDNVNQYSDFEVNFTISYAYLDTASTSVDVV